MAFDGKIKLISSIILIQVESVINLNTKTVTQVGKLFKCMLLIATLLEYLQSQIHECV